MEIMDFFIGGFDRVGVDLVRNVCVTHVNSLDESEMEYFP